MELRQVFANVLNNFLPNPLLKTENMPSFARAFVTEQLGRRIVHVLSYVPESRGEKTEMVEEPIPIPNAKIALRNDGKAPKRIYIALNEKKLKGENRGGYTHVNIQLINGYALVVFEE